MSSIFVISKISKFSYFVLGSQVPHLFSMTFSLESLW